jgi:hypothetical protein
MLDAAVARSVALACADALTEAEAGEATAVAWLSVATSAEACRVADVR